ncbi:hypothetical protein [Rhodococcus sp. 27YEA15]|uniref:hypothetical protein n=1 Tax=Rhodococcus sp. 27YEA15 TaxID=3156259 RepID=UPI003C7BBDD1
MIHLAERYGTRLRLEPSHDNEIRVDITHSGGTESHFPEALDLLESVEAIVESMGLRKPRTVETIAELEALPERSVVQNKHGYPGEISPVSGRSVIFWAGNECEDELTEVALPATVLFTPGGE